MKWSELKNIVDKEIEKMELNDPQIGYIDAYGLHKPERLIFFIDEDGEFCVDVEIHFGN